ncbi:WD40 repeat-like protein [Gloeophyllum trabeum ATCC 11539]|uniref:Ribosome biogenesis protein YTM1 n=1 Tax=Gloeophyllum trabeum (strain ATCC 11539 / FP-39264 / Madison 617) TaxID=670483 RepID=S7PSZ9_GLOTA|nr:WD40 repeat-like protein [Gloeophyllum trabeum ATCC 11539]EPQ50488.1 WD40 repeat-like protein [Gloeophyllum trabeum ATCC 11539]
MASEATRPVVFTTSTPYPLPTQKFMIPVSWRRYQLSQLINKALSLEKPVPFDFLVRGEILRGSLAEWCAEKGVGEEETLEIEYIESVLPPQKFSSMPHEDWVSAVSCRVPRTFVTGSYDGSIRTFSYSRQLLQTVHIHEAPITSLCVLPSSESNDAHTVATASQDMTARLTTVQSTPDTRDPPSSKILASLHLHTAPVSSVSVNSSGSHLLTASWDTLIGVWSTSVPADDEISPDDLAPGRVSKRRRLTTKEKGSAEEGQVRRKAPVQVMKSHTARVTKAVFGGEGTAASRSAAYSCGLDSTVRTWDVESGVCLQTINASEKPMTDLALMPGGQTALAAATDRTVTAYDLRLSPTSSAPAVASMLHPSLPSCLTVPLSPLNTGAANASAHQFLSGAYDGAVRLWDLRSVKAPIASFKIAEGKVLSVDWAVLEQSGSGIAGVGGEGGLEVWKIGADSTPTPLEK